MIIMGNFFSLKGNYDKQKIGKTFDTKVLRFYLYILLLYMCNVRIICEGEKKCESFHSTTSSSFFFYHDNHFKCLS